ncbi:MAG: hypothetical protein C0393_02160, partial [Anaerolinea sp.]|nr:hypothetical protein [Anaerolinea sp.]
WYLRAPDPEAVLFAIRRCLQERCAHGSMRFFLQGQRLTLEPSPPDSLLHVQLDSLASRSRLDLVTGTQGEISLYHMGFLLQKGPCPVPHLCFSWNTGYRPEIGDAAAAVARDFSAALKTLEDTLVSGLNAGTVSARLWALFLASAPAPEVLDRPLGRDLLGQAFTTRDLIEKTVLTISPVRTLPPGGSKLLLLDEARWSPAILQDLREAAERLGHGLDLDGGAGIAARRWNPAPEDPRSRWPRLWEALAERDSRLAFSEGLVLAELHRPDTQAWPFFPVDDSGELARLRALPPVPWNLHGALWLAVNHPLVEHLTTLAEPAEAVWILARLFLLSQDLEPDDGSLP